MDTATELRRQEVAETGPAQTQYPHHPKVYQTVIWKDQALQVLPNGVLRLPVGGQRPPLLLSLPEEYRQAHLRRAEWTWRADHDELCLTLDTGGDAPPAATGGRRRWRRPALLVSRRELRACKQWRNPVHSVPQERLRRCQVGSRRAKRLLTRQAQVSAKRSRQQREILRQAARTLATSRPASAWASRPIRRAASGRMGGSHGT